VPDPAAGGPPATALLLDYGGVVLRSGLEALAGLASRHPELRDVARRRGPLGAEHDTQWDAMMRRDITEREYWSLRSAEFGRAFGEDWDTRTMMSRLFDAELPEQERIRPEAAAAIAAARAAGLPVGILTNDLAAFHDQDWIDGQQVLSQVDEIIDGSVTGVLKPDPRAYALAASALGVEAGQIVFVDDIPWNVDGARAAGMTAYLLDYCDPAAAFGAARRILGLGADGYPN
jgi:putative hydrolase of the HAD superfamily